MCYTLLVLWLAKIDSNLNAKLYKILRTYVVVCKKMAMPCTNGKGTNIEFEIKLPYLYPI